MHVCVYVHGQTYMSMYLWMDVGRHACIYMHVCMYAFIYVSHRGGLQQYYYDVHALGIIHQQQSWFGAIC